MKIEADDLSRPAIHALLEEHLRSMHALGPPESVHAFDLETMRRPEITFWSAWEGELLLGCGAERGLGLLHIGDVGITELSLGRDTVVGHGLGTDNDQDGGGEGRQFEHDETSG